jgi:hypothetical protein
LQLTLQQTNWQKPEFGHWLKHSLLPLLLLLLFLLLPKPWEDSQTILFPTLEIELDKTPEQSSKPKPIEPEIIEPKPIEHEPTEIKPRIKTAFESSATNPQEVSPQKSITEPTKKPPNAITKPITTSDILLSVKNRVSMDIPPEFQARTGPAKDFYIPEQEIENWLADIPFLDESVDRPTIQMKFYSEGFTGHIEKFFDKITISKTFTTKYGTKFHCALIGVIAACGWK